MDEEYDVVVLGTGMVECVLSGLLSVMGKKVLHTDRNPYYGGESASMNLKELYQKFKKVDPPSDMGAQRDYCIDLILKLIMAEDSMVKKFRCSTVYKYMTFQQIDGIFVYRDKKLYKIPTTSKEALVSPLLGMFQKRYLNSFLSDLEKCDISKNEVPQGLSHMSTMKEVYTKYGLNDDNQELVGHGLALYQDDEYINQPCMQTFKRMMLFKTSLLAYGKSPYIYPVYGLGEIPQSFARLSAVYGGTYMLNTAATGIELDAEGVVTAVKYGDKSVKTKCVIGDPSYFQDRVRKVKSVVRSICILNHPVKAISPCESCQIIIPTRQTKRKSDIYVSVISPNFNTSPSGFYIAIVSTVVESKNPEEDVKPGLDLLSPVLEKFLSVTDVMEPLDDGTKSKVFISKSYDATTHFETACSDIDDLWKRITGEAFDEAFFLEKTKNSQQQ